MNKDKTRSRPAEVRPRQPGRRRNTYVAPHAVQFGERLEFARKKAGYETRKAAIEAFPESANLAARTYYAHERGERLPDNEDTIDLYCAAFTVSREFLVFGEGDEAEEFSKDQGIERKAKINQPVQQLKEISSQIEGVRYIPILRASEIQNFIQGKGNLTDMSKDRLPLPRHLLAGPNSFSYEMPLDDLSMVTPNSNSFGPGAHLVVDPDQEIKPLKFIMVQFPGWKEPSIRQLQSSRPVSRENPNFPIKLAPLNELFEPIECASAEECEILGRVVFTLNTL